MKRKNDEIDDVDSSAKAETEDGDASAKAASDQTGSTTEAAADRKFPKQRMAVLFGYRGTGYRGSQLNPGQETIEKVLMDAFVAANAITAANNDPKKVGLNRCARTDKGVHAAGNVISLKMMAIPNIVEAVNSQLPPHIRIFDIFQVTSSFNAKNHCGGRQYEYTFPTYFLKKAARQLYPLSKVAASKGSDSPDANEPSVCDEDYAELCKYRLDSADLEHLREILQFFKGTHNFHNFTVGVKYKEKNAGRYISSFTACEPYTREDGVQWISVHVAGQSFMLHQIRKMVGLAVMMVRTSTPSLLVENVYKDIKVNIPKVPGIGLLLRKPIFTAYNTQHKFIHSNRQDIEFDNYEKIIRPFVETFINADLYSKEASEHVFMKWFQNIDLRSNNYAWWLTVDGSIREDMKPDGDHDEDVEGDEYAVSNEVEN